MTAATYTATRPSAPMALARRWLKGNERIVAVLVLMLALLAFVAILVEESVR